MVQQVADKKLTNGLWELPRGWQWRELSEIAKTTSGGTPSRKNLEYFRGNIPWVKSGELENDWIFDTEEKISQAAVEKSNAKILPRGTLLMAMYGATVGKLGILGVEAATNQAVCAIIPNESLDRDFLFYYLTSRRAVLLNQSFGGAQPNISQALIREIKIPTPLLIEQKKIVARIKALLAEVRESRELIARMRQDAEQVMEAALGRVIEKIDEQYPDSPTIGELLSSKHIQLEGGGTPSRSDESYWNGLLPWVSPKDMKRWYINDAQEHISNTALQKTAVKLIPRGAVLMVVRGMILAHTLPVGITQTEVTINQDMKALVPKDNFLPDYLGYILRARSPSILQKVEIAAHGTRRLKTDTLMQVVVPDLSKNDQRRIVAYLNSVQAEVDEILKLLKQDANLLDLLEQSILERAFCGEL